MLFSTNDGYSLRTFPDEKSHLQMLVLLAGDQQLPEIRQTLQCGMECIVPKQD
jgi:hypothetical protein